MPKLLSKSDFISLKIDALLDTCENPCYSSYCLKLSALVREEPPDNIAKIATLSLLGRICSMVLTPDNLHQPFRPMFVMSTSRGMILDDLDEEEVLFCQEICNDLSNNYLRARVFDILWTLDKKNISYVKNAIDAYTAIHLDGNYVNREHYDMWERAIRLMLKRGSAFLDRKKKVRDELLAQFRNLKYTADYRIIKLADLLSLLCNSTRIYNDVFERLFAYGELAAKDKSWYWARDFFRKSMEWVKRFDSTNQERLAEIYYRLGKIWEDEAAGEHTPKMVSGQAYRDALKEYRAIPRKYRERYNIDEKLSEIQTKMRSANIDAKEEFSSIEIPLDLSEVIAQSRKRIIGKNILVAMKALIHIHPWLNKDELQKQSELINAGSIANIMSRKYFSPDGRVIAFSPGMDFSDLNSEASKLASHCNLMELYDLKIEVIVKGCIMPALEIFNIEHRIAEADLYRLCLDSVHIPRDRAFFWAKGLYYGFELKFIEATHILSPQIEHWVRLLLKQAGHKTSVVDPKGIENETGLSTLLEHEKIGEVLNGTMIFELKSLMSAQPGPNLRNEIAHGLLSEDAAQAFQCVYLWWLALKIMTIGLPYMNETK